MHRFRLPLAALALSLLATACHSTAPMAPREPTAPEVATYGTVTDTVARGGNLIGSGN